MESRNVEKLMYELNKDPEAYKELPKIAEASGIFLALANSIKVGYKPTWFYKNKMNNPERYSNILIDEKEKENWKDN